MKKALRSKTGTGEKLIAKAWEPQQIKSNAKHDKPAVGGLGKANSKRAIDVRTDEPAVGKLGENNLSIREKGDAHGDANQISKEAPGDYATTANDDLESDTMNFECTSELSANSFYETRRSRSHRLVNFCNFFYFDTLQIWKEGRDTGFTPLRFAVVMNDRNLIRELISMPEVAIEAPLDQDYPEFAHSKGQTILHTALGFADAQTVQMLLDEGCSMAAREHSGFQALHVLCLLPHDRPWILEACIAADPMALGSLLEDSKNNPQLTPLLAACFAGNCKCMHVLVRYGANFSARDARGASALHLAAISGSPGSVRCVREIVKVSKSLLNKKVKAQQDDLCEFNNWTGCTPLMLAAMYARYAAARALLEAGADIKAKNREFVGRADGKSRRGKTALHYAIDNGHQAVADLLDAFLQSKNEKKATGQGKDEEEKPERAQREAMWATLRRETKDVNIW